MKIILATCNPGKIRELKALFKGLPFQLLTQEECGIPEIEETGLSFIENAILKARHVARMSGYPSIADDSGLVVPALNGAPGIYSARYAGAHAAPMAHINKLLAALAAFPAEKRAAYFYCTLAFLSHAEDPTPLICQGKWLGSILTEVRGEEGFGYDPIFYVPSENKTAAEIPLVLKNKLSHRGKALQLLIQSLAEKLDDISFRS